MDATVFLAGLGSLVALIGANMALISWIRTDMKSFESELRVWNAEINKEMKDFHGRLCAIEEKIRKPKTDP